MDSEFLRQRMKQQCGGCIYWRPLSTSNGSGYACHFLLTAHRRRRTDEKGRCLERKKSLDKSKNGRDTE